MPKTRIWVALLLGIAGSGCSLITPVARPTAAELSLASADTFRAAIVAGGVKHLYAWESVGPWAVHVLEVSRSCNPAWEARKAGPGLSGRATTSALGQNALAAINADFFALPAGTPVGVQVRGSEVLIGPADRPMAVAFTRRGQWIDVARLDATLRTAHTNVPITQVNRPRSPNAQPAARLFTHWYGASAPADTQLTTVRVRAFENGRGIVELVDATGNAIWLEESQIVLHVPRMFSLSAGDTVTWRLQVLPASGGEPAVEALGGFPWLLRAGQAVLAQQPGVRPEFGEQRHPRSAIGFTVDGRALLVVVDGRQAPYSDGMTLKELTDLMQRLGAHDALNLDGGGSTALAIRGRAVNRPSDREGQRAVGNALALVRCK
ncbi:MAG: phosphodiester glycosidase family protein [Gemmatimonadota bacterium]